MSRFVVEPAVALKWFLPEVHSERAARLLDGGHDLAAPDSLHLEAAAILAVKARRGELAPSEAAKVLDALRDVPLWTCPSGALLEAALEIALALSRPLGDGLGLALAVQRDCRLVTAKRSLVEAARSAFSRHLKWVGDLR